MPYTIIDHTADIGIEVEEENMNRAFETAAKAMFDILTGKKEMTPRKVKTLRCSASDPSQLLVDFLSELLYLAEVDRFLVDRAQVTIKEGPEWRLISSLEGERYEPGDGSIDTEIKAVTYHMLEVEGGHLKVLFDI